MTLGGYVPFPTYRLLEATVEAEYLALSAANKVAYSLLISAGAIDFRIGSKAQEKIFSLFPTGTQTRINIEALLEYTPSPENP